MPKYWQCLLFLCFFRLNTCYYSGKVSCQFSITSLFSLGLPGKISVFCRRTCCLSFLKTIRNRWFFWFWVFFSAIKVNLFYRLRTPIPSCTSFSLLSMCPRDNWSILSCTSSLEAQLRAVLACNMCSVLYR